MTDTGDKPKALFMLSGGLDSTVAAFVANEMYEPLMALSFDYGQRARRRELAAAYGVASALGIPHRTVFLPFFRELDTGPLTDVAKALPEPDRIDLDNQDVTEDTARAVWVPNRNGIFVSVGAAWAESIGADVLVVGFNVEEARTFPDNSADFVESQNAALRYSTSNHVEVIAPTLEWTKAEIVARAMKDELPLELVWSCYDGESEPCGRCESCKRFDRAIDTADARDWFNQRLRNSGRRT